MDEIEAKYKNVDLTNIASVGEAIEFSENGIKYSSAKITKISHELERLKTILEEKEKGYTKNLETSFAEVCQLTANAQQIINLRKLVLTKEIRVSF